MLSRDEARAFYDRFGARQDRQAFYEDPALRDMIAHAELEVASHVFEFGCGTGRLAKELLERHLPSTAEYHGIDLSPVMVELARERLSRFGARVSVQPAKNGPPDFGVTAGSIDRVVTTYVLDLLSEKDIAAVLEEAHRVLQPGGRLCVVSLTEGTSPLSRIVVALWKALFRIHPRLLGGCRPLALTGFLSTPRWRLLHRSVVTPYGLPSEVVVAERAV